MRALESALETKLDHSAFFHAILIFEVPANEVWEGSMQGLLDRMLRRLVVVGRLTVRWPDGTTSDYGRDETPAAAFALTDAQTVRRIALNPGLAAGEAYMAGTLQPLGCTIYEVLDVLLRNLAETPAAMATMRWRDMLAQTVRRIVQFNPTPRSRRNVAHHYDLNGRLYSLFLDRDRQYSCAYFPCGDETLEQAQIAKKRHIAAKLKLDRPGLRVLDIGSGWGGLALSLARDHGADVTGITLSVEQHEAATARAQAEGLSDRVRFELRDYRHVHEKYDRIVSVGMFEHVGVSHYRQFFNTVRRCLARDGVALVHAIGRGTPPGRTNPWITKYIFPGGYCPALSEVFPAIERVGLTATDVEILRLHYAETLRHWRWRFAANRDTIESLYDERFCRMFEFYLAASEATFRAGGQMVFQIQLTHTIDAVPLTRDYITEAEQRARKDAHVAAE
jgi:cyclopropane-fatty-acyl-phospholipid synthase